MGEVKGRVETDKAGNPALSDWRGGVTFFNEEEEQFYDDEYDYHGPDFDEDEEDEDEWDDYNDDSDPYDAF